MSNLLHQMKKKGNVRSLLIVISSVPCLILAVISAFTVYTLNHLSEHIASDGQEYLPGVLLASDMSEDILNASNSIKTAYINRDDVGSRVQGTQLASSSIQSFSEALEKFKKLKMSPEVKELLTELEGVWPDLKPQMEEAIAKLSRPNQENIASALELIAVDIRENGTEMVTILDDLRTTYKEVSTARSGTAVGFAQKTLVGALVAGFLGILFSLFVAFFGGRTILTNLSTISGAIDSVGEKLKSASQESLSAGEKLSSTATNQSESLQLSASTLDELVAVVRSNTENANSAAGISKKSEENALSGKNQLESLTHTVGQISEANQQVIEQLKNGNEQLANFQEIIDGINSKAQIINDIVFQTRLLSFNASVEAARAGEHGKGFAVVAEEIANLAKMSGNAAVEITNLLDTSKNAVEKIIGDSSQRLVGIEKETRQQISLSIEKADQCSEILENLVGVASTTATQAADIAVASDQQSRGIESMKEAMRSLTDGMNETTTIATQSAKAAHNLADEVDSLQLISEDLSQMMGQKTKRVA